MGDSVMRGAEGHPLGEERQSAAGEVIWFTGLSGSGKTTLASGLRARMESEGARVKIIDGDVVRAHRKRPLGFSREAILENGRDVIEMCEEARRSADFVLVALITPLDAVRREARKRLGPHYFEVFVSTPVEECRSRDTKGLYAMEAKGKLSDLIGVSPGSPFERPTQPDIELDTSALSEGEALTLLLGALNDRDPHLSVRDRIG